MKEQIKLLANTFNFTRASDTDTFIWVFKKKGDTTIELCWRNHRPDEIELMITNKEFGRLVTVYIKDLTNVQFWMFEDITEE